MAKPKERLVVAIDFETLTVSKSHPYVVNGAVYLKLPDHDRPIKGLCGFAFDNKASAEHFKKLLTHYILLEGEQK
jgi:hypothetical protein